MKLSEKILYCRKKAGLSQEALANKIGVSRQAISKWETGESTPEVGKLQPLSQVFGVSLDWLLSDDAPQPETAASEETPHAAPSDTPSKLDSVPGWIGKLLRRYGWLFGVYTALSGLGFTVIGVLAQVLSRRMFSSMFQEFDPLGTGGTIWQDAGGTAIADPFSTQLSSFANNNPVTTLGAVIMWFGIILMVLGIGLAIYLKKRSR